MLTFFLYLFVAECMIQTSLQYYCLNEKVWGLRPHHPAIRACANSYKVIQLREVGQGTSSLVRPANLTLRRSSSRTTGILRVWYADCAIKSGRYFIRQTWNRMCDTVNLVWWIRTTGQAAGRLVLFSGCRQLLKLSRKPLVAACAVCTALQTGRV